MFVGTPMSLFLQILRKKLLSHPEKRKLSLYMYTGGVQHNEMEEVYQELVHEIYDKIEIKSILEGICQKIENKYPE